MRFVSPSLSVRLGAVSALALMAGHGPIAMALPSYGSVAGIVGLALGTFALGRYWGQMRDGTGAQDKVLRQSESAQVHLDAQGELATCTGAAQILLGAKSFELEGDGLKNRIHIQDMPEFLTRLSSVAHSGANATSAVRVLLGEQSGENHHHYTLVNFDLCRDAEGQIVAALRLHDTTSQLQDDLQNARQLMEAAKQAKSNFLSSVGHELRTPLNAIIGFSDLLNANVKGELNPAQRDYIAHIHQSGTHLLGLVNSLLDMSRLDAGHMQLSLENVAAAKVITSVTNMLSPQARAAKIELVVDLPTALPMIVADERACRQMIINLASNAIKFSDAGSQIIIRARRIRDNLQIEVSDSGIGIAGHALGKLGTPFYQVQNGPDRSYEGTGLGLSIVKGLVELHQGKLSFASIAGQGTQVRLLLPIDGPQQAEEPGTTPQPGTPTEITVNPVQKTAAPKSARAIRHARG